MARQTEYKPEYCQDAAKLCAQGATDKELAEFFEVSDRTIYRWKAQFPDFCQALKVAKDIADDRVERSLYHKAVGYTFSAVKIFMPGGATAPVYAPYEEHMPPDTTAAIFWLKNRRPDRWRDKTEQEVTGADGGPLVPIINLTIGPKPDPASEAGGSVPDKSD
jgi:Homeodomain-like domain-containing protein